MRVGQLKAKEVKKEARNAREAILFSIQLLAG